jgi:hypothetical protein
MFIINAKVSIMNMIVYKDILNQIRKSATLYDVGDGSQFYRIRHKENYVKKKIYYTC